jgi:hypothetical protein
MRIVLDQGKPSAAVEIPLEKPLPDYDLEEIEQPTPRHIDGILVSQGFRDLVDDARGILMELLAGSGIEIAQLTGAICPADDEVYRPGLWIVAKDTHAAARATLPAASQERIAAAATELVSRLQLA